jgi:hypothetical protein
LNLSSDEHICWQTYTRTSETPSPKVKIKFLSNSCRKWQFFLVYCYIYIQQDATLHNLSYLETALHFSGGTITHHQESKQLYLQHLVFFTPLLLSAAIVKGLELV